MIRNSGYTATVMTPDVKSGPRYRPHYAPGCPAEEVRRIAERTGLRGSGHVGRSAAGRALDAAAVDLAVIAHVWHVHTPYDELLMRGTERLDARTLVREKIDAVLAVWSGA